MLRASRAHLADVGESYFEHMRFAFLVGALAAGAGLACMLHALVPGLCQTTCSRTVRSLYKLLDDRSQLAAVVADNGPLILFVLLTGLSCVTAMALAIWTAGTLIGLIVIPQAFALPLIFLSQNPGLERSPPDLCTAVAKGAHGARASVTFDSERLGRWQGTHGQPQPRHEKRADGRHRGLRPHEIGASRRCGSAAKVTKVTSADGRGEPRRLAPRREIRRFSAGDGSREGEGDGRR